MRFIEVSSRKLFFEDVQPEKTKPLATLVLVHGAGGAYVDWRRQIAELSARFRIIAVDLPGHGWSDVIGESTIDSYAQSVVALIRSLDLEKVVVGGHSMGGAVALKVAMNGVAGLSGLLLVGTGARLRVLPAIFTLIREDFELAKKGMANFMFGPDAPPELIVEENRSLAMSSADQMVKDFVACDSFDVFDRVGSITVPTLIICGENDRLTPPKYSEYLHREIRGSEISVFDGCGHMPMLEQSLEFNKAVSDFLINLQ